MSNKKLSLAFIGGGINSAVGTTHKLAAQMDERWELVAGCFSRNNDINVSTGTNWNIDNDRLYSSPEELFENEKGKLDAVVILTPTPSHPELVIKAIKSGYAVICEKSLACSSTEANQVNQAVKEHNAFLALTYNYTGYPMLRELQHLIKNGKLGKIDQIQIEMPQEGFRKVDKNGAPLTPQDWRLSDKNIPTISLDLGVHLVQMIKFLSAETPLEVVATESNIGNFTGIIDNVMCIAKYTGDLSCQIWYSKTALGQSNGLKVRVYGGSGSAEWLQMEPEYLIYHNQLGDKSIITRSSSMAEESKKLSYNRFKAGHPAGFIEAFANYYYDLADSLIEYKEKGTFLSPWIFSSVDAENDLKMLEAISLSSKENKWIKT
ncbi:MAG: gfo/Idh/MocA family oxidoreductase [Methyloprofundus sp.]|nr:gfo/Idh/MocA family oxidoreductase [Methyloprofundus sp.]